MKHSHYKTSHQKSKKRKKVNLTQFWFQRLLWLMPLTVGLLTAYALSK
ncbi:MULTISPECIES: hypothetical protein [Vibrio]|nr:MULTISPECIES: hypothetical protein [Vibrio]